MRNAILKATAKVILKHGVEGTSMRLVCGELGITAPTLYHYFKDKDHLLDEVTALAFDKHLEMTLKISKTKDPLSNLKNLWDFYIQFAMNETDLYLCIVYSHTKGRNHPSGIKCFEITRNYFKELASHRKLKHSPVHCAQAYYSAAQGAALLLISQHKNPDLMIGTHHLRDLILNGSVLN